MRLLDWLVVAAYVGWVVIDGLRRSKGTDKVDGYFLANRSLPWWAVGLSVMATQMSAVTMVATTGQGYLSGLRFVQFYFGLPLAMIILSLTVVPFFTRARVYTAYEYLERRFDTRTRSLASLLFLVGRAFSLGVTLAAPAVVMSSILGWHLPVTILVICVPMIMYTTVGGVQAVAWTDVKQMFIVVGGMLAAAGILLYGILQHVSLNQALHLAGATGRLQAVDFNFDPRETYTFWSGMIGALFLNLAYFGCDQSQVQRYLTAKSIDEARQSLLMSAYVKIPLQLLILGSGVLVFVFYLFQPPPMLFNRSYDAQVAAGPHAAQYAVLQQDFDRAIATRRDAAQRGNRDEFLASDAHVRNIRSNAADLVRQTTGDQRYSDVNYVFPTFITTAMPIGLVGLMDFGGNSGGQYSNNSTCTGCSQFDASMLQFVYAGPGNISMRGNSGAAATFYAPNASVIMKGTADLYGSLLGKTVDNQGNANIHYDRRLSHDFYVEGAQSLGTFTWRSAS